MLKSNLHALAMRRAAPQWEPLESVGRAWDREGAAFHSNNELMKGPFNERDYITSVSKRDQEGLHRCLSHTQQYVQ